MIRKNLLFSFVLVLVLLTGCSKYPKIEYSQIPIPENAEEDTVGYPIELPGIQSQYWGAGSKFSGGQFNGYTIELVHYFIIDDKNPDISPFYKDKLIPQGWELIEESNKVNRYGSLDNIMVWKRENQIIHIVTYPHPLANMGNDTTIMAVGLFYK